jgi:hypothetical protein
VSGNELSSGGDAAEVVAVDGNEVGGGCCLDCWGFVVSLSYLVCESLEVGGVFIIW